MTAVATTLDRAVVADGMHHGVIACDPETPLAKAAQMMAAHRVHCVVVRGAAGAEWAVVSDLDLVGRLAAAAIADCDAGSAAATPALTVSPPNHSSARRR